ncbi:N-terminal domain of NEFA-interacting nuclear protein NIP30-domain-containing protein [Mrakia frigida]|uniref:PSME3-interacting protein n=1 Tax=Mrakia frigida TaxID=29902 RepID=UPI003FCBF36D
MSGISLQTTGGVSSRFVSETDLDKAKATKDQEWKAAYERLGQAPPPREEEEAYDPRSLFEKLQQKKDIKREEMDEKMKMSNQHRGLNEEELGFLTDHKNKSDRDARQRRLEEEAVLDQFRSFVLRFSAPLWLLFYTDTSRECPRVVSEWVFRSQTTY